MGPTKSLTFSRVCSQGLPCSGLGIPVICTKSSMLEVELMGSPNIAGWKIHLMMVFNPEKMWIFHGYVGLPEGTVSVLSLKKAYTARCNFTLPGATLHCQVPLSTKEMVYSISVLSICKTIPGTKAPLLSR